MIFDRNCIISSIIKLGIILAAGLGTRLQNLELKPLAPVGDIEILLELFAVLKLPDVAK